MTRRRAIGIAAVIGLVAGVLIFFGRGGDNGARPTASAPPVRAAAVTPVRAATPEATEDGARAAAIHAATASQRWLYLEDEQIRTEVRALATQRAAPRLERDTVAEISLARRSLSASPGRVWWIVRPLAWRLELLTSETASVSVWTVTVLSAADVAVPQADWVTLAVDLEWTGDRWLVDGIRDDPGPTPAVSPRDEPWQPEPFDDALDRFTRMDPAA